MDVMQDTSRLSVRELEAMCSGDQSFVPRGLLARLRRDPRKGAGRLYRKLSKRLAAEKSERERARKMRALETTLWTSGVSHVAGVDEVGIGPMAGPVVAAAVVFPPGASLDAIDDSKKLDSITREALDREIMERASAVGIGQVDVADVDRLNVYHAGLLAMRRAVESLRVRPEHVLVDARTIPDLSCHQRSLIKGDTLSFSIAAASIVAKVWRDRLMSELDSVYPGYGFRSHKGYCSPEHQRAVRRLGPCPIHRRSFDFIRELTGEYDPAFYDLLERIGTLRTPGDLESWEASFEDARGRLSARARRKLRVLAARRSKAEGWL